MPSHCQKTEIFTLPCQKHLHKISHISFQDTFSLYRTKSNPANQAPTEACTHFTNGSYKKLRSLSKSEKSRISQAIKQNQKCVVQRHIPPLQPEPAENAKNAIVFKYQRSRRDENSYNFSTAENSPRKFQNNKNIKNSQDVKAKPLDASGHYRENFKIKITQILKKNL